MAAGDRRILFISAAFPPWKTPESDHALQECLRLAERGHEVHVLTTRREEVVAPPPLHVHAVMDTWGWSELPRLLRVVRQVKPAAGMIFFLGWMYNYRAMITIAPTVVKLLSPGARFVSQFTNLGVGGAKGGGVRDKLRRLLFARLGQLRYGTMLAQSDALIVMSHQHLDKVAEIKPRLRDKTELIPPSPLVRVLPEADAPRARRAARQRLGVPTDAFLFTYFARLYPRKGIENLLRAFAEVVPEMPDARLAMVGGYYASEAWYAGRDYPSQLSALVDELGIADRISWSGEYDWDSDEPSEYLHASDVAVLPYDSGVYLHNSSFAAVASHGVPTIATRGSIVEDAIVHGENVHLVQPRDVGALTEALRALYRDQVYRQRLGKGVRALADEWFAWERSTDRIMAMLGVAAAATSEAPPAAASQ